jgi:hypothetical protein
LQSFEVLNGGSTPQVEQVPADADIASPVSFARGDVSESVFHGGAAAEQCPAWAGLLKLTVLALS